MLCSTLVRLSELDVIRVGSPTPCHISISADTISGNLFHYASLFPCYTPPLPFTFYPITTAVLRTPARLFHTPATLPLGAYAFRAAAAAPPPLPARRPPALTPAPLAISRLRRRRCLVTTYRYLLRSLHHVTPACDRHQPPTSPTTGFLPCAALLLPRCLRRVVLDAPAWLVRNVRFPFVPGLVLPGLLLRLPLPYETV